MKKLFAWLLLPLYWPVLLFMRRFHLGNQTYEQQKAVMLRNEIARQMRRGLVNTISQLPDDAEIRRELENL